MEMLGLIIASIAIAVAASAVGAPAYEPFPPFFSYSHLPHPSHTHNRKPVMDLMTSSSALIMQLVHWIMYVTPIGVFSLLAGRLAEVLFHALF